MNAYRASVQPISTDSFAEAVERVFGTPESESALLRLSLMPSAAGQLVLADKDDALCALEFVAADDVEDQLRSLRRRSQRVAIIESSRCLDRARSQLEEYFAGRRTRFELTLAWDGTEFQQKVWSTLLEIPYGETWSYLKVAERVGDAGATRAVGMANNANPIAIIVPCHRVVNASGALGGYGGGLWRKRILLDLEKGQGSLAL